MMNQPPYQQPPYAYYPPPPQRPNRASWILLGIVIGIFLCIASVVIVPALFINHPTTTYTTYSSNDSTASSSQIVNFITPTPKDDAPSNPWGYNFQPEAGHYIYDAPTNFCRYFNCQEPFGTSNDGFVVECHNGKYSHAGGNEDACLHDGGVDRALYWH